MHEMSLAMSALEIVNREMERYPGRPLSAVELQVGEMAGIELQCFETAMNAVIAGSQHAGARVEIDLIEAEAACMDCGAHFHPEGYFPECPECGSALCGITRGREFRIVALRLKD